jgi:hypothetical protein
VLISIGIDVVVSGGIFEWMLVAVSAFDVLEGLGKLLQMMF